MITGIDISGYSTVSDLNAMITGQLPIEFAYVRGYNGFRDDSKFTAHRKLMEQARNASGAVLWGAYMYLGYSAQLGSEKWIAGRGDAQAANFWSLITAGGKTFQLPPAIDVEENRWRDENGVSQTVPMPSAEAYCDTYLLPAVEYLTKAHGRRPIVYSSPNKILYYLAPALRLPKFAPILECPLWLAHYNKSNAPGYMDKIAEIGWKDWLIWQYAGDVSDWPGVDDVDLNRIRGTRSQLKAWANDPKAPFPKEGGPNPDPDPDPEPNPDPVPADILAALKQIDVRLSALQAQVNDIDADVTVVRSHFKP